GAAVVIGPTTAAFGRGLRKPNVISVPEPISVAAARRACSQPGRSPSPSNHLVVPSRPPLPNTLLAPWAISMGPSAKRITRAAMSVSLLLLRLLTRCSSPTSFQLRVSPGAVLRRKTAQEAPNGEPGQGPISDRSAPSGHLPGGSGGE